MELTKPVARQDRVMPLSGRHNSAAQVQGQSMHRHVEENMHVYLGAEHNVVFISAHMVRAKTSITASTQSFNSSRKP